MWWNQLLLLLEQDVHFQASLQSCIDQGEAAYRKWVFFCLQLYYSVLLRDVSNWYLYTSTCIHYPSFGTFNISSLFFRLANFSSMHGLQYILGKEYDGMEAARNKALKGESLIPMQVWAHSCCIMVVLTRVLKILLHVAFISYPYICIHPIMLTCND